MTFNPHTELEQPFGSYPELIASWGRDRPDRIALDDGSESLNWGQVAALVDRIAAQLQSDGLKKGQAVAILGTTSVRYALVYLAALRAGGCAAPLTTSATPAQLAAMLTDSGAMHLFVDASKLADLAGQDSTSSIPAAPLARQRASSIPALCVGSTQQLEPMPGTANLTRAR
jgi:acyl-CoA synthetase (AMP-forming)/AMP-acid ligase II